MNGYTVVKEQAENMNPDSLVAEITDILVHEIQRCIKFAWKDYPFISNEEIVATLSSSSRTTRFSTVLQHYHEISFESQMEILSQSGSKISCAEIYQVLKRFFPKELKANLSDEDGSRLDPTLRSIMARFGKRLPPRHPLSVNSEKVDSFLKLMNLQTMRRAAQAELHFLMETAPSQAKAFGPASQNISMGVVTLSLIIQKAKDLPKMDVGRGVDVFCVAFLEHASGLFQTEIRRGRRESDWQWDEKLSSSFKWELPNDPQHLYSARKIVVMIYDKDQISGDDLVGCVTVSLGELNEDGIFDSWKQINRPPKEKFQAFASNKNGELKLKITMRYEETHKTAGASNMRAEALPSPRNSILAAEGSESEWAMSISDPMPALESGNGIPTTGIVLKEVDRDQNQDFNFYGVSRRITTKNRPVETSNAAPLACAVLGFDAVSDKLGNGSCISSTDLVLA